jgi:transcription termination/antitermination protein NusG
VAQPVTEMAKLYPERPMTIETTPAAIIAAPPCGASLLESSSTLRWHVASTRSRHERTVQEHLLARSVESYLPLCESLRQWHDRRKRITLPAFPGYIFVRIAFAERMQVLTTPGITRLVSFGSMTATLADDELERLRIALTMRKAEPHPYLASGTRVRIMAGPLRGLSGVVQRGQGLRIILSVDCLCRSVAVELQESDLQPE